jgi:hypothetical protein
MIGFQKRSRGAPGPGTNKKPAVMHSNKKAEIKISFACLGSCFLRALSEVRAERG